ncbi:MAG: hypothetical protein ABH885_08235, partial [Candidatus Omnitrophota bacterium]
MTPFRALFGADKAEIRTACILTPFLNRAFLAGLNVGRPAEGRLYKTVSGKAFSVIQTGMGAPFAGDCVLFLRETACRDIMFFGSCGITGL